MRVAASPLGKPSLSSRSLLLPEGIGRTDEDRDERGRAGERKERLSGRLLPEICEERLVCPSFIFLGWEEHHGEFFQEFRLQSRREMREFFFFTFPPLLPVTPRWNARCVGEGCYVLRHVVALLISESLSAVRKRNKADT